MSAPNPAFDLSRRSKKKGCPILAHFARVGIRTVNRQVTITNSKDESVTLYLDSTTHVPIKKTFSWRDSTDKERNTEEEVYDNYKRVQDILTPYSLTRFYNGDMAYQRFLSKITYNDNLADSLFEATLTK